MELIQQYLEIINPSPYSWQEGIYSDTSSFILITAPRQSGKTYTALRKMFQYLELHTMNNILYINQYESEHRYTQRICNNIASNLGLDCRILPGVMEFPESQSRIYFSSTNNLDMNTRERSYNYIIIDDAENISSTHWTEIYRNLRIDSNIIVTGTKVYRHGHSLLDYLYYESFIIWSKYTLNSPEDIRPPNLNDLDRMITNTITTQEISNMSLQPNVDLTTIRSALYMMQIQDEIDN